MNVLSSKEFEALQYMEFDMVYPAGDWDEISVLCPDCPEEGAWCEECRGAGTRWLELPAVERARLRAGEYEAPAGEPRERPESREEFEWGRGDYLYDRTKDGD